MPPVKTRVPVGRWRSLLGRGFGTRHTARGPGTRYVVNEIAGFGVTRPLPRSELLWAIGVFYSQELDQDAWPYRQLLVAVSIRIPQ